MKKIPFTQCVEIGNASSGFTAVTFPLTPGWTMEVEGMFVSVDVPTGLSDVPTFVAYGFLPPVPTPPAALLVPVPITVNLYPGQNQLVPIKGVNMSGQEISVNIISSPSDPSIEGYVTVWGNLVFDH